MKKRVGFVFAWFAVVGVLLILGNLMAWISLERFSIIGESGLRVVAQVTILSCLVCAILFWEIE